MSARARVARGGISGKPHLNRIPSRIVDDRRVFARMGFSLVNGLAVLAQLVFESPRSISTPRGIAAVSDNLTRFCRDRLLW